MKKLLILSTTLLTFNSFAIEFKDKGNILGELNKFLDSPTYENSFSLGEVSSFDTKTCTYFDDQNLCETSSLELKVGAVDDIEVIIENSDANSEDFIVSKNKWEKYKGNYIQIMLDDRDWLQSIQTKNTNLVDNDEVAYEYEVLGSRFIKIDHLGQDKSAMIVTGILKWRNGLVAAANFRIVKGMSFLASLNSYSIDLIGFAKVSMTLREYDHNENSCYKNYISEYISTMPKSGRGQFQQIARALNCHSTLISQIFNGSRDLNLEQALKLCDYYNFEYRERRYFLTMVEFARAGDFKLRKHFESELNFQKEEALTLKNRLKTKEDLEDFEKARFYSDSIYSIVRLLTMIPEYSNAKLISQKLKVSESHVDEILEFLISCGLVEYDESGLKVGKNKTFIDKSNPLILNHHRNWRLKAIDAQVRKKSKDQFFTGPLVVSKDDYNRIKIRLGDFLEELYEIVGPSPSENLYCLNIDLFEVLE